MITNNNLMLLLQLNKTIGGGSRNMTDALQSLNTKIVIKNTPKVDQKFSDFETSNNSTGLIEFNNYIKQK